MNKTLMMETPLYADERKAQQQKTEKKLGSITLKKGHTLFECNLQTGVCEPATIQQNDTKYLTKDLSDKKTYAAKGKVYIGALNAKNAEKKIVKILQKYAQTQSKNTKTN
jgi:hypothetical protein